MLSRWTIRNKLLFGVALLFLIVAILAFSSFRGVYAYRHLARSISYQRATELRLAAEISWNVGEMRSCVARAQPRTDFTPSRLSPAVDLAVLREEFRENFLHVKDALDGYKKQLRRFEQERRDDPDVGDRNPEWETVRNIERSLAEIAKLNQDDYWVFNTVKIVDLDQALTDLNMLALQLPLDIQRRMHQFAGEVRGQYRIWIVLTWVTSISSMILIGFLLNFLYKALFCPLRVLIRGSRRVARDGDFNHRILLDTHDEVAELAEAMNAMTDRFQRIRDDLDWQVKQRTKEVVRSEQLASVGFLAAGVAHEINNPLASIAWCAESLESRMHDIIQADAEKPDGEHSEEVAILRNYLRKIQDEAFRCKGITEQLLDFSRMGDVERNQTNLAELVEGVIEMVRHLGKYREKNVSFQCDGYVTATVNAQELKQVVLNLITNSLDSIDAGGNVEVTLRRTEAWAELTVTDDGCGMTDEVMQHLFEPFFTRRRDGQGTGLGLSITYRIIEDHGGKIVPHSDGPGKGSQFRVILPMVEKNEKEFKEQYKVA